MKSDKEIKSDETVENSQSFWSDALDEYVLNHTVAGKYLSI